MQKDIVLKIIRDKIMDNKKDIEDKNNTNKELTSADKNDVNPIDFFSKDESFVYIYRKTEKLATALYMVTNLFSDHEPMKWTLRTKVSNLLSYIIGFKDISESLEEEFTSEVKTKVLEIVSLLEIAFRSGLVSSMNFSILKNEFVNMVNFISQFKKSTNHYTDLGKNFFEVSKNTTPSFKVKQENQAEDIRQNSVLDLPKRTNRQNIIINMLRKKKELTINDIAETITDCSEKTIQRELISLIKAGLVQRVGQRRWSKYMLISSSN